jgi:hypothetical protein
MRSLWLLLIVALIYLANGRAIGSADTLPARYLPFSIVRELDFDLDEFTHLYDESARRGYPLWRGIPYFLRYHNGHYLSAYPPGPALLALPIYAIPVMAGVSPTSPWAPGIEKLAATLITAFSVLFLYWALKELVTERWALTIAGVYAFGTSSLSISSQALWQHGPSQFFLALALYWLVKGGREDRYIAYASFALTSSICMRPTNALIALPFALYIACKHRAVVMKCILFSIPPMTFFLLYNYWYFGSIRGGYGSVSLDAPSFIWQTPVGEGIAGLLFSPGRGLLIYSPVFILSLVGVGVVWAKGPQLFRYASIGLLLVVLLYSKWFMWWGGWTYGPRLLSDLTPLLCMYLYPLCHAMDRWRLLRAGFVALGLLSVGCHALGAWWYDFRWDLVHNPDQYPARLWQWRESPLVHYARRGVSDVAIALFRHPTSRHASPRLAASYYLTELFPGSTVRHDPCRSPSLSVSVTAVNDGSAVWLASARQGRGMVQLGWRWLREGTEVPETSGRQALAYDVFPGQSYAFTANMTPSPRAGDYVLELGLVSEHVTWFSDQGSAPLTVALRVVDAEGFRAEPSQAVSDPPQLVISTPRPRYRQGEVLEMRGDLVNADRERTVDVYLALVWPDGQVSFWNGNKLFVDPQDPWVPLVKGVHLVKGVRLTQYPFLTLKSGGLPSGRYTGYLILTEANTCRAIAQAQTSFLLETGEQAHEHQ